MSTQTYFNSKGAHTPPNCIDCGVILANYALWHRGDGPLCFLCKGKRRKKDQGQSQREGQLTRNMGDRDPWRKKQQMAKPADETPKKKEDENEPPQPT